MNVMEAQSQFPGHMAEAGGAGAAAGDRGDDGVGARQPLLGAGSVVPEAGRGHGAPGCGAGAGWRLRSYF